MTVSSAHNGIPVVRVLWGNGMMMLSQNDLQKSGRRLRQLSWETKLPSAEDYRSRLKVIVMQETCHVREVCFLRLKYQSRWSRTPVSDKFNWGAFECGIEWYCSVLLGAMYAGICLVLSMGDFYYCERPPRTVAFWLWDFDFSQLKLGSKLNYFN